MIGIPAVANGFEQGGIVGEVVADELENDQVGLEGILVALEKGELIRLSGTAESERDDVVFRRRVTPVEEAAQDCLQLLLDRQLCGFDEAVADQNDAECARRLRDR